MILQHCPSVCHTHPLTGGVGKAVSFTTVGHEYPSNLLVTLTVTDAQGLTDIETVELDPKTVDLTFVTNPAGGAITVGESGVFSPSHPALHPGQHRRRLGAGHPHRQRRQLHVLVLVGRRRPLALDDPPASRRRYTATYVAAVRPVAAVAAESDAGHRRSADGDVLRGWSTDPTVAR